jgi:hypothetical protein
MAVATVRTAGPMATTTVVGSVAGAYVRDGVIGSVATADVACRVVSSLTTTDVWSWVIGSVPTADMAGWVISAVFPIGDRCADRGHAHQREDEQEAHIAHFHFGDSPN